MATYQHHLQELRSADIDHDHAALTAALNDPDQLAGDAAAVDHLDRVAAQRPSAASFTAWLRQHEDLFPADSYCHHRAQQWLPLKHLQENPQTPLSLAELDDWTQRQLSHHSDSPPHLRALADSGRTRRIRRLAQARLDQLQPNDSSS
ncbi:hypothetical protein FHR75_004083 [Kineococcus radiotolerans]|uniref:Uncharacterized protein n=1 Tax=Kineococcus radiotolerans TaxID=131568 RepID=A0A7W4XYJ7_KINRA|nr:hypothetical protein [Kineococcus radiotolerans]MBB2903241.1 hypothetical protein [Kineococcus radiotolerans]